MVVFDATGEDNNDNNTTSTAVSFPTETETSLRTTTQPSVTISATPETNRESKSISHPANDSTVDPPKRRKPVVNVRARGPLFGLAQWMRLLRSTKDLAQRKGAPYRKDIPWDEVRKHNQPHDCWMVLRGIVYNIGPYLAYHPGGIEIFTKARLLGEDGTKLFDKYHRWVSIEGLIGVLAIGSVENPGDEGDDEDQNNHPSSRREDKGYK